FDFDTESPPCPLGGTPFPHQGGAQFARPDAARSHSGGAARQGHQSRSPRAILAY
ncbi:unnamed protein product, partial [Amoebophrya sp. A120]